MFSTDDQQIVNYAKAAASTNSSVDGNTVVGGSVASIPLANAAFVPAPAQQQGAAPPAAAAPAVSSAPAADQAAVTSDAAITTITAVAGSTITLPLLDGASVAGAGTTTTTVTVPAAASVA